MHGKALELSSQGNISRELILPPTEPVEKEKNINFPSSHFTGVIRLPVLSKYTVPYAVAVDRELGRRIINTLKRNKNATLFQWKIHGMLFKVQ